MNKYNNPKTLTNSKSITNLIKRQDSSQPVVTSVVDFIDVEKPRKEEFFRVHPNKEYHFDVLICKDKYNPTHLVNPSLQTSLNHFVKRKTLVTVITRNGEIKLFPIRANARDKWTESAKKAIELGVSDWVQLVPLRYKATYKVRVAKGDLPEPEWPNLSPEEIFTTAFDGFVINDLKHPYARKLLGLT